MNENYIEIMPTRLVRSVGIKEIVFLSRSNPIKMFDWTKLPNAYGSADTPSIPKQNKPSSIMKKVCVDINWTLAPSKWKVRIGPSGILPLLKQSNPSNLGSCPIDSWPTPQSNPSSGIWDSGEPESIIICPSENCCEGLKGKNLFPTLMPFTVT